MGIDAKILLRVKGNPANTEIRMWSYQIAEVLGADKFFIQRNEGSGAICKTLSRHRREGDPLPGPGTVYYQDGPDINAEPGETLLQVNVWTRYYGVGYERGDLLLICAIAEWCEANIPNCEVWYGGDSSGVVAEPFPEEKRRALRAHLYSPLGREYYRYGMGETQSPKPDVSNCKLCIPNSSPRQYGFGGSYAAYYCPGCGLHFTTRDNGKTWTMGKESENL